MCSADESGEVIIWFIDKIKLCLKSKAEGDGVPCSSIDHCRGLILLGKIDGSISFLDKITGSYRQKIIAHGGPLTALSVHQETLQVSTVSSEGTLRIWSIQSNSNNNKNHLPIQIRLLSNICFQTTPLTGVQYCSKHRLAITGYDSNTLLIYSCPEEALDQN
eukprot:g4366.t1